MKYDMAKRTTAVVISGELQRTDLGHALPAEPESAIVGNARLNTGDKVNMES